MKRIVFITFVMIVTSTTLHAQEFGIGARIGPSVSTLLTDEIDLQESFTFVGGGQVEAYAYKMFKKWVGIEGGLMFLQSGYGLESDDLDEEYDTKITYFALPLSARFKFGYFTVNPGIRPSFLIKAKQEGNDFTDQVATTDVGVFVSPGLQFPNGITLNSTIYIGVTDVIEGAADEGISNTNFSLQFSVGYTFYRKGN